MKNTIAFCLLSLSLLIPALAQSPAEFHRTAVPRQTLASRDPFVWQGSAPTVPRVDSEVPPEAPPVSVARPETPDPAPEAKPAPPPVTVTGIVSGPTSYAILNAPGRSWLVQVGDRVGDFRVASIASKCVTFTCGDSKFKVAL